MRAVYIGTDVKPWRVFTSTDAAAAAAAAAASLRVVVESLCPRVIHVIRDAADGRPRSQLILNSSLFLWHVLLCAGLVDCGADRDTTARGICTARHVSLHYKLSADSPTRPSILLRQCALKAFAWATFPLPETISVMCLVMVALWNRADHYIFILFLLSSFFFFIS